MSDLKTAIGEATKDAMKAREKERVATLRMVNAEIKRVEVDERRKLSDADVTGILKKMVKQRQDALVQFTDAGRYDLARTEASEIEVIEEFLPEALSPEALSALVDQAITEMGAAGMADMGKVMGKLKSLSDGHADLGQASALVKEKLKES